MIADVAIRQTIAAEYGPFMPVRLGLARHASCKACGRPVRPHEALVIGEDGQAARTSRRVRATDDAMHAACADSPKPAAPLADPHGRWLDALGDYGDHVLACADCREMQPCATGDALVAREQTIWRAWQRQRDGAL